MMRIRTWSGLATLAVIGMMATSAFAQQPGGGGRGRGGPGGFGGSGFGGPQSALSLSNNAAVQKDASITEEQAGKLKALNDEAQAEIREAMSGLGSFRDLSEEERTTRMTEMSAKRAEINKKFKAKLSDILETKQIERLDQIALQASGTQVYADPDVIASLKLSEKQQEKIKEINRTASEKRREMFGRPGEGGAGGGDFQERMAKMNELTAQQSKDLEAVLTADQKAQFAKMKGKEFDVAQLRQGGGRRPGGEGQRGDGQRGGNRGGGDRPRRPE